MGACPRNIEGGHSVSWVSPKKVSHEEIINAYKETGSVWKAGKILGVSGQSVHERLRALDYKLNGRFWTNEEKEELKLLVMNGLTAGEISRRLGRTFAAIALKISRLGLNQFYKRKTFQRNVPRGVGFDKVSVLKYCKEIDKFQGTI